MVTDQIPELNARVEKVLTAFPDTAPSLPNTRRVL